MLAGTCTTAPGTTEPPSIPRPSATAAPVVAYACAMRALNSSEPVCATAGEASGGCVRERAGERELSDLPKRRVRNALIGDDGADEGGGCHVECPIRGPRLAGRGTRAPEAQHFAGVAVLDRDGRAAVGVQVDRRRGRSDVEGHLMSIGEHRKGVRADLVGHVAVGRDPVGTHDHDVDIAAREQRAGHRVGDDRVGNPEPTELPRGEPRTLEQGPSLVDPNLHPLVRLRRGPDHTQRGAVPDGGQRPGVAMRQRTRAVIDQGGAERAERAVPGNVSVGDALRFRERRRRTPGRVRGKGALDSPREVHRGWPGPREASRRAAHPAARWGPSTPRAPRRTRPRRRAPARHAPRAIGSQPPVRRPTRTRGNESRCGNARWSTSRTRPCRHSMVGGIGSRASGHRRQCRTRWESSGARVPATALGGLGRTKTCR